MDNKLQIPNRIIGGAGVWSDSSPASTILTRELFEYVDPTLVTWNANDKFPSISLHDANHIARAQIPANGTFAAGLVRATASLSGLKYFEIKTDYDDLLVYQGIINESASLDGTGAAEGAVIIHDVFGNFILQDIATAATIGSWTATPSFSYIFGFAFDAPNNTLYVSCNGIWEVGDPVAGTGGATLTADTYYPTSFILSQSYTVSTLQADYSTYSPPTGYTLLGAPVATRKRRIFIM